MKSVLTAILGVVLVLIIISTTQQGIVWLLNKWNTDPGTYQTPEGLVITKDLFMQECLRGATDPSVWTTAQATQYCGCVYDDSLKTYGPKQMMVEFDKLADTNTISDQTNQIINSCVGQATAVSI